MPYAPPPNELAYFEGLFLQADVTKTQALNGRDAVAFLHRSKLSIEILKHIWTLADQPKTNALDKAKFFTSVRLIQLFQNGQSAAIHGGNATLTVAEGIVLRPPFFEGVTGVSVHPYALQQPQLQPGQGQGQPMSMNQNSPVPSPTRGRRNSADSISSMTRGTPIQQQQQQAQQLQQAQQQQLPPSMSNQTSLATQDPYVMPPNEQTRYAALFPQYEKDGHVYGAEAVALFSKSGLSKEVLRDIWNMVDNPVDNRLSNLEFCIAMHLIVCISKKNLPMPTVLPPSLRALKGSKDKDQAQGTATNPAMDGKETQPSDAPQLPNLTIQATLSNQSQNAMNSNPNATTIPTPTAPTLNISDAFQGMSPEPQVQIPSSTSAYAVAQQPAPATIEVNSSSNGTVVSGLGLSVISSSPNRAAPMYPDPIPENNSQTTPVAPVISQVAPVQNSKINTDIPNTSQAKLESVQGILQKLQAENISLKAQLSHFSQEDQRTREEIHTTVSEIATLSQELTGLRAQVVDAKGKLIEATSELRAQVEKRDILKSMVIDAQQTRDAIAAGVTEVQEAREASKLQRVAATPANGSRDIFQPNVFDDPTPKSAPGQNASSSSNVDGYVDVASAYYGAPPVQPVEEKSTKVSDKDLSELEQCKEKAETARIEYELLKDQTHALVLTYEDLKAQADRQDILISQKQKSLPKKKGFMRGTNKTAKKEIEAAQEIANQLRYDAQEAHDRMMLTKAQDKNLQMKALELADKAHEMEMTLTQQASRVESRPHDTKNFHTIEHVSSSEAIPPPPPPSYNYSDPYGGQPPIPPLHMGTPSGMGYGGNPATPARPIDTKKIPPSDPSSALGGQITDGSNYGSASVLTDNTSYFGGASAAGSVSVLGYTSDAASYAASQAFSVHSEKNICGGGTMSGYDSGANLYVAESNQGGKEENTSIMGGYASGAGSIGASKVEQDSMGGYASGPGSIAASNSYAASSIAGGSVTHKHFSQEQPSNDNDESATIGSIVDNKPSDVSHGISYSDQTSAFGSTTGISYSGHTETNSHLEKSKDILSSHAETESADDSMRKANMSMASMTITDGIPSPDKPSLVDPVYQFDGSMDQPVSIDNLPSPRTMASGEDVTAAESAGEAYNLQVKNSNYGVGLELPSPTSFDNTHLPGGIDGFDELPSTQDMSNGVGGGIPSPVKSHTSMASNSHQDVGSLMDFENQNKSTDTVPPSQLESSQRVSTDSSSLNQLDSFPVNGTFPSESAVPTPVKSSQQMSMEGFGLLDTPLSPKGSTDVPLSLLSPNPVGPGVMGTTNRDDFSGEGAMAFGAISQMGSGDDGGIPSPTISMDEYENPFSNMGPAN